MQLITKPKIPRSTSLTFRTISQKIKREERSLRKAKMVEELKRKAKRVKKVKENDVIF